MVNQNITPKEAYKIGEVYDFKVRLQSGTFCEVIDEANIHAVASAPSLIEGRPRRCSDGCGRAPLRRPTP